MAPTARSPMQSVQPAAAAPLAQARRRSRADQMKIALISPLYEAVPPTLYGGTERVVAALADELAARGHDVTLFAAAGSQTAARLEPMAPRPLRLEMSAAQMIDVAPHLHLKMLTDPLDLDYWHNEIEPLTKSDHVEYLGEITEAEKPAFLAGAAATLFPSDWPEPFGLVMIESLAAGTPVVALRRGSVPEVLTDQVSGFICDDLDDMVAWNASTRSLTGP